jgi:hypothetical protein
MIPTPIAKRIFLLIWCMNLVPLYMWAQKTQWKPYGTAELGLLLGSYEPSGDWRLKAGLQRGPLMLGLGSGVDYYRFRTVPVMATGQYNFGKKQHKPFASLAAGISLAHLEDYQKLQYWTPWNGRWPGGNWVEPNYANYESGWMAEAGGGYAFYGKKGHGLQLSLHYSFKSIREWYPATAWGGNGESTSYNEETTYFMHRTALRLAYKW